jgi:palmitoyl-protein thioesterase
VAVGYLSFASTATAAIAVAAPLQKPHKASRPVVFYHGMGDTANSKGMQGIFDSIKEFDPEIFIYSIHVRLLLLGSVSPNPRIVL